jgi:putative protein-disulfide isomerase
MQLVLGFSPAWQELLSLLPSKRQSHSLPDGLTADSNRVIPLNLQQQTQAIWRDIQQNIPGTHFNFDFWKKCIPRRSTYPARKVVISIRLQVPDLESGMILLSSKPAICKRETLLIIPL